MESVSRIFIVPYGALVRRLSSPSTADFNTPPTFSLPGRRVYSVGGFPFCQSQQPWQTCPSSRNWAAVASPTGPWGGGGTLAGPGTRRCPGSSQLVAPHPNTPPCTALILQVAPESLCPSMPPTSTAGHHTPEQPQHQPQITAQTRVDSWRAGEGDSGLGRGPFLPFPKEQMDTGARTETLAAQPTALPHSSFSYRFYRSATEAGRKVATSH